MRTPREERGPQPDVDRVVQVGAAVAGAAAALPFLVLRPNRVAAGVGLSLFSSFTPFEVSLFAFAVVGCFALATAVRPSAGTAVALGITGNGLVLLLLVAAAGNVPRLELAHGAGPFARVSLAPGLWLAVLGAFTIILGCYRRLGAGARIAMVLAAPLLLALLSLFGWLGSLSLAQEFVAYRDRFAEQLEFHVAIAAAATVIATVIGVPLGIWAFRRQAPGRWILAGVNAVQTVPSLALFGLLIAPLAALAQAVPLLASIGVSGIGTTPALIALTLYAVLPITRNTYASLMTIDPAIAQAGMGMGMGKARLLASVQVPLALPIVLTGVRTALVQAIGNTAIAALIGAGGFGVFIFQGLGQAAPDLILLGTIPVIVLALGVDRLALAAIRLLTPKGVRDEAVAA